MPSSKSVYFFVLGARRSQGLFSNSTGGLEMSIAKGTSSGSIEEGGEKKKLSIS